MKALVGLALVGVHAVAFAVVVPTFSSAELVLTIAPGLSADRGEPSGVLPPGLGDRAERDVVGAAGLRHARYSVTYRGGFTRSVGVSGLVGPFQDPAKPACTGRVVIHQKLLDDGKDDSKTIATEIARTLGAELDGESYAVIGKFEKVKDVRLRWAQPHAHPDDWSMIGDVPRGYVRATAQLAFENINIPVVVALIPQSSRDKLAFKVVARAQLELSNRALQWLSDKLGGDKLATRLARREIDNTLITALAPPPPFELPGGGRLTFGYCDGPVEIVEGAYGALPFSIAIGDAALGSTKIRPPRRGPAPYAPLGAGSVAIDLDLDGANALLYELWRFGFLDRQLASAGLDKRFNEDPIVTEYLSLRITPPTLALPPVLGSGPKGLQLFADARVTISDGTAKTVGRVWGGLDFSFGAGRRESEKPHVPPPTKTIIAPVGVDLGALELSCERSATELVPCYADLVGAMRDRGSDFHGALTRAFVDILNDVFVGQRVGGSGLSADLVIRGVTPTSQQKGDNGSLHLELDSVLDPKR